MRYIMLSLLCLGATTAQAADYQGQAAMQGVIEKTIEDSNERNLPVMMHVAQEIMQADRDINTIYQILNNKLVAQGKPTIDRQQMLKHFAAPDQVVYVPLTDDAQAQADAEFRDQQEAALMGIVNTMQDARWASSRKTQKTAQKAAQKIINATEVAPMVNQSGN